MDRSIYFLLLIYAFFSTISVVVIDIAMSAGFILAAVSLYRNKPSLGFDTSILRFNGLFLLACALSIIFAYKPLLAVNRTWGFFFDMMPLFLTLFFIRSQTQIRTLLYALAASFFVSTLFALYQGLSGHERASGFIANQPPQGFASLLVLFILLFLVLTTKKSVYVTKIKWWAQLLVIASCVVLVLNGTRSAWLALIVLLPLFAVIHLRSYRKTLAGLVGSFLIICLFFAVTPQLEEHRVRLVRITKPSNYSMTNPDSERLYKWQMATAVFLDYPILGVGIDNYTSIPDYDRYLPPKAIERRPSNAHNVFFHLLAETGIVGLTAFIAMFGNILYYCWRQYKTNSENLLCLATIYATLGLLLLGQTEYNINDFALMRLYWLLVGLAWQNSTLLSRESGST